MRSNELTRRTVPASARSGELKELWRRTAREEPAEGAEVGGGALASPISLRRLRSNEPWRRTPAAVILLMSEGPPPLLDRGCVCSRVCSESASRLSMATAASFAACPATFPASSGLPLSCPSTEGLFLPSSSSQRFCSPSTHSIAAFFDSLVSRARSSAFAPPSETCAPSPETDMERLLFTRSGLFVGRSAAGAPLTSISGCGGCGGGGLDWSICTSNLLIMFPTELGARLTRPTAAPSALPWTRLADWLRAICVAELDAA